MGGVTVGKLDNPANQDLPDMSRREVAYMAPILVLIVVMGVYPQPFLAKMAPSVDRVLAQVQPAPTKKTAVRRSRQGSKAARRSKAGRRGKANRGKRSGPSRKIINLGKRR